MSLQRFYNREQILKINSPLYGQLFKNEDLLLLDIQNLSPYDPKLIENNIGELHVYSPLGDYLGGDINVEYIVVDDVTNSLLINIRRVFQYANIIRGGYKVVINLFKPLVGSHDRYPLFVREISPDRTELKLELLPEHSLEDSQEFSLFKETTKDLKAQDILNHVILNFGYNKISRVINIKFDSVDSGVVYVKLYDSLELDIDEKETLWIGFEIMDPYIDNVLLVENEPKIQFNKLRGPNFDLDTGLLNSNSTQFKNWEELLDSGVTTRQHIINELLSGSSIQLNIDYTDYSNFIVYSSAKERLANFRYKLQMIEYYESKISKLDLSSGSSGSSLVLANKNLLYDRIGTIKSSFSQFERWLYYEPTSSLFTHGVTGSLTPWPKYVENSQLKVHHTTSSIAVDWYISNITSASYYDQGNYSRLSATIPDHIQRDPNNSEYMLFLDMIGEHFDELYGYVSSLTSVFERDEHPQLGTPNELFPYIAESFGWKLQNTRQLTDLWLYAAGTNSSGSYQVPSGSMVSVPHRNLNYQVWRRIVNNLPYLLKTKGTSRSVKSLISIYGIPHTFLSIREFGGPSRDVTKPGYVDDKFSYRLLLDGKSRVVIPRAPVSSSEGPWGGSLRNPDTIEFRFSTNYSSSVSMSLYSIESAADRNTTFLDLSLVHSSYLVGTSSYSGSYSYGKLDLKVYDDVGTVYSASSQHLPLFDSDVWNVRIWSNSPIVDSGVLWFEVAKSADCTFGEITFSSSGSISVANVSNTIGTSLGGNKYHYAVLGGSTGSAGASSGRNYSHYFSGSVQHYKEYLEVIKDDVFYDHVLNPSAYHGNSETSSYYTLYRYFPLGGDGLRYDHTQYLNISSSQPNQNITFYVSASMEGFTGTQSTQYLSEREQEYVRTPTLGGSSIVNEKVRIENSKLVSELSSDSRSSLGEYDGVPIDTNRLMIVFSPTAQVNRDIYNHFGTFALDDYIGSPGDQYEDTYSSLKEIACEYWKKWVRRFDINEFVKIFSIYDYTIFEQIKQLLPARADYIGGVLIEPNILERSKVHWKRPSIEELNYRKSLTLFNGVHSGEYLTYTSSIASTSSLNLEYRYHKTDLSVSHSIEIRHSYYTSSFLLTASIESKYSYYSASFNLYDAYSGSTGVTQSIIDSYRVTPCYSLVKYHYSASGLYLTEYRTEFAQFVSRSYNWYYSRSLCDVNYQIDECSVRNRSRFVGSKLVGIDFNIDSDDTVDGGPVVLYKEVSPNKLSINRNSEGGIRIF